MQHYRYEGQIFVVTGQGGVLTLTVVQIVGTGLQLSERSLIFMATEGAVGPAPQSFSVANRGTGALAWAATATTTSGGVWLNVGTPSGTSTAGATPPVVTISVQPEGLRPGAYFGQVRVSIPATAEVLSLPVALTVTPARLQSTLSIVPAQLAFTAQAGGVDPAGQAVLLRNVSSSPVTVRMTTSAPWLVLDRTQEVVTPRPLLVSLPSRE
jgi:hypothetical protein